MIMKMLVINQEKAANNHNLFDNVKVIHKYNVRSSLIADLRSTSVRFVPEAVVQLFIFEMKPRAHGLSGSSVQVNTIN